MSANKMSQDNSKTWQVITRYPVFRKQQSLFSPFNTKILAYTKIYVT